LLIRAVLHVLQGAAEGDEAAGSTRRRKPAAAAEQANGSQQTAEKPEATAEPDSKKSK
jgi:hypothetical protein